MEENRNIFYHASNIGGLLRLKPLSKQHGGHEKVCYFTPNKTYALFYLRDMDIDHVTCGVDNNGIAVYHEQFPNQLEVLYKGRRGSIYHCQSGGIKKGHAGSVWVATAPVEVYAEEQIDSVFDSIIEAEGLGKVRIIRYQTLPREKKAEIVEMIKNYILKDGMLYSGTPKAAFMQKYFPRSWALAQEESRDYRPADGGKI